MGPKQHQLVDELIIALRDPRVLDALASVLESKMQTVVAELIQENEKQSVRIAQLECKLQAATDRVEALEAYSRRDNLIITGLPAGNYVEAVVTENTNREESPGLPNTSVERSVLKLFNEQLGVSVQPTDISVAHRLKRQGDSAPTTLVKFTNRKAREAVYAARRKLREYHQMRVYINEDLNKNTADLFRKAHQLVRSKVIFSTWTAACTVFIKRLTILAADLGKFLLLLTSQLWSVDCPGDDF